MGSGPESGRSKPPAPEMADLLDVLQEGRAQALVICLSHAWGGLEQVAANDALDLGAAGVPVRVMCLEGSPMHENLSGRGEVSVHPLNFRPRDYFDLKMRSELDRLIGEGVNLIHTHQPSLLGSITPWLWSRPNVCVFASRHIMNSHNKKNFFHRAIYGRLDALVVMSQNLRRNVMQTHPLRERQVKVVNLGLDFNRFDPETVDPQAQREKWGADPDTLVIGMVGRIDPAKGQSTFIKAAAGLLKQRDGSGQEGLPKIKFVIVGEETRGRAATHLQELKEMVRQFRMEEDVVFAGFQENVPEVMRSLDIFVMPSREETFGLVAIEAMAMECPIIISNGGSAEEIVGRAAEGAAQAYREFGLLVKPEDAFDLQRQLRYLIERPTERQAMGARGRDHVKKNYDRRLRLLRTLELYERGFRRRRIV